MVRRIGLVLATLALLTTFDSPMSERIGRAGGGADCGDFLNWAAAEIWFLQHGGPALDPANLDQDNDGIPCESLTGAPGNSATATAFVLGLTPTATRPSTPTPSLTPTFTATRTPTPTVSPSPVPSSTPVPTATHTNTLPPTAAPTATATSTPSLTNTVPPTSTPTNTPTTAPTALPTNTPIVTPSPTTAAVRIRDIQGAAHLSPLNGTVVAHVPGVVTAKRSNGFHLQDPSPDANDATSEGIFVFTGAAPTVTAIGNGGAVNVGDVLTVSGTVTEFRPGGNSGIYA